MTLSCKDDGALKMPAKDSDSESFDDSDKSGSEDGDEDLVRERCQFHSISRCCIHGVSWGKTLLETDIGPENGPSQKGNYCNIPTIHF